MTEMTNIFNGVEKDLT